MVVPFEAGSLKKDNHYVSTTTNMNLYIFFVLDHCEPQGPPHLLHLHSDPLQNKKQAQK